MLIFNACIINSVNSLSSIITYSNKPSTSYITIRKLSTSLILLLNWPVCVRIKAANFENSAKRTLNEGECSQFYTFAYLGVLCTHCRLKQPVAYLLFMISGATAIVSHKQLLALVNMMQKKRDTKN